MDKYEYNLKLDQMKSRYAEEKYDEAADIADTINWNKVKNVNGLVKAGEVYEKVQRYEESREVLLMAYDRSPIGRMIIYRLAEVAVKMKDFQAAQDYYDEFVEIAPHDTLKYVLRYDIQKAQGASYEELIPILEELKEQEYTEEWAYELAYLYHKAGMSEKCIDACDELVLWFGDGPYVERALELKMLYQPLTKTQEEKYRSFCQAKDDRAGLTHIDVEEMARAGETVHDPVAIPKVEVNTERFNTVNLQAEIAKGMQQIMDATEKETVTDTLDNINRMVEDVPYLKMQMEEEKPEAQPEQNTRHIETDEEIDGSLKTNFKELLGEDSDGQMSMMTNEKNMIEHQITGQMTIEEVLSEWEKMRKAAEAALEDARKRKLESAKARALQEAGDIMDRLTGVLPKLDAVLAEKADIVEETTETPPQTPERETPPATNEPEERKEEEEENKKEEQPARDTDAEELWPEGVSLEEMVRSQQKKKTEAAAQKPAEETSDVTEDDKNLNENRGVEEMETKTESDTTKKKDFEEVPIEDLPQKPTLAQEREEEFAFVRRKTDRSSWKGKTVHIPQVDTPVDLGKEEKQNLPLVELTDEQKAIFSYFMPVKGMEDQLCKALTVASSHLKNKETASVLSTKWLPYSNVIRLKGVEDMVEVYYNSGQFPATMKLLEKKFARPSEIFTSLAEYYEKNGLTGISHSRLARYEILYRFLEEKEVKVEQSTPAAEDPAGMEQKTGAKAAETAVKLTLADFRDSLMYDLYVRENIKSRPSFASDQSPYKKEVREFFMAEEESPQWLTDYAGFDSKQMAKMAHLEHMEDGTFVLFDYKNRDPLSGNARAVRFRYDQKGSRMVPAKPARI